MNITAVESTTLAALAYDEAREILQLEFRSCASIGTLEFPRRYMKR